MVKNPFSFFPFLGGRRICLGKTFAELASKFVSSIILSNFEFEAVDKRIKDKKPPLSFSTFETVKVEMIVKAR